MYPRLRERARDAEVYEQDPVRFEVMLHLGYFVTESSGHFSEYVPYFRKRPELIERYTRGGYLGESGFYANNWPRWRAEQDTAMREMVDGTNGDPDRTQRRVRVDDRRGGGARQAARDLRQRPQRRADRQPAAGRLRRGRVPRRRERDLSRRAFGPLPEQVAALNRSHMAVHELVVQALLERDREKARTRSCSTRSPPPSARSTRSSAMFDEMWDAQAADLDVVRLDEC